MPSDTKKNGRRRIAVIGGGISGMGAAWRLSGEHDVVLFEAERRLGGHARTVVAGKRGDQPVDTGFIVFNHANYPRLTKLFDELGVPVADSNMSFAASLQGGRIEYGLRGLGALFAQKRNALNPAYLRMLRDILRFNANALDAARDPSITVGGLLGKLGTGPWFRDCYLLPLSGAIWSTPKHGILDFPAKALVEFFRNHALMGLTGQHRWFTVEGGSREYVGRLEAALAAGGVDLRLGAKAAAVRRPGPGIEIKVKGGAWDAFDEVVLATHSDDALRLLADANDIEKAALSAIGYQPNDAVLHADARMMPRNRACWSSWNYTEATDKSSDRIDMTYWMNSLQPIPDDDPIFVTLNSARAIREDLIYDQVTFRHPVYTLEALQGQELIRRINGANATWFCGAWMRNGFHEDGLASAFDVADAMLAKPAKPMAAAA